MNEYTILSDLEQNSSTEVKLCRLTLLDSTNLTSNDLDSLRPARVCGSNHDGDSATDADAGKSLIAGDDDEDSSNLYVRTLVGACAAFVGPRVCTTLARFSSGWVFQKAFFRSTVQSSSLKISSPFIPSHPFASCSGDEDLRQGENNAARFLVCP